MLQAHALSSHKLIPSVMNMTFESLTAFRVSPVSTSGPQLDVQSGDPQLLAPLSHILSRQHSSIRRGLVSVGLHLHPTSNTADCFPEDQEEGKLIQKMITTQM